MDDTSPESCTGEHDPSYSFYFVMKPFRYLRQAVKVLSDPDFNDHGLGRIDVDDKGFEITVENESKAVASLHLTSCTMTRFQFSKPIIGKFVNLGSLFQTFPKDIDDVVVHVFHVDGEDGLWFKFETDPQDGFSVKFNTTDSKIKRYFPIYPLYEVLITSIDLRDMLKHASETGDPKNTTVTLDVKKDFTEITIGRDNWIFYRRNTGVMGALGLRGKVTKRALFNWTTTKFLKKASHLEPTVFMGILSIPKDHVMYRFGSIELGRVLIINEVATEPEPEPANKGDTAEESSD